ncbi:MAG: toxin-antitoxin system TumE family protein [Chloroflexota bacterium]
MTAFLRSSYETLLYTLVEQFVEVRTSTLRLYPTAKTTAIVRGSVFFKNDLELRVFEYLDLSDGEILDYSYTIYRGEKKIRWYDPQPHPENRDLASTFPHHFHEEPSIKQNRKPAPGISFDSPNLPALIKACAKLGK